jgi:trehalose 6-phosphate synthase/phosphatase
MMNYSIAETVFKVRANLLPGEEVHVSGNVPALGCYDPNRSVPLITTSADFPWWSTEECVFLPGAPDAVKYKYCIFSGGKFDRWECDGKLERTLKSNHTEDEYGEENSKYANTAKITAQGSSFLSKQFAAWGHNNLKINQVNPNDAVIIVAYFLPVILNRSTSGEWSAVWDQENILTLQLDAKIIRVGSVRYMGAPIPIEEEDAVSYVLSEMRCYPVFINKNMHFQFYDIFCKQTLWPTMHHIADVYGPLNQNDIGAKAQQNVWFVYSTVHKMFRDKILEVFYEGYLVWINGFHLMLLPSFLRRRLPTAKIGYFFHTPFPSSEIWRTMTRREDLLRGILGADQIGFHLFEYARHFFTTCHRLLGCSYEMNPAGVMTLTVDGRDVAVTCIHVGVDQQKIDELVVSPSVTGKIKWWRKKLSNKIIVAGIDRLERLKGVPLKLMAIEQFMAANSQWLGKICFAIIGVSASERGQDYHQTRHDVKSRVDQLNAKYSRNGEPLVHFEERQEKDIHLEERLAFFGAADILLITATRDGLNRYPMEFTLARRRQEEILGDDPSMVRDKSLPVFQHGLIIVSEFISSARVMRGALTVNPWKAEEVVSALKQALEMDQLQRFDRSRRNVEFSTRLTTDAWATMVLNDLKNVEKQADSNATLAVGFGMQYKVMDLKAGFKQLNLKNCCYDYRKAQNRLILLDWGGTLVADNKDDHLQAFAIATGFDAHRFDSSTVELKETLKSLCSDPKNTVFVISGKESRLLTDFFGSFEGLGLAAEHGFYYKWPDVRRIEERSTRWRTIMEMGNQAWKSSAKVLMDLYVQRTHGSYVEQKGNALIWQFRDADPEFGYMQSKELQEHLNDLLKGFNVDVLRGGGVADGYIEVRPAGVSKGLFLEHALSTLKSINKPADFVLAIGDDSSDEPMFERLSSMKKNRSFVSLKSTYGVTVGKKPTHANSYIDDSAAVIELLQSLTKSSARGLEVEMLGTGDRVSALARNDSVSSTNSQDSSSNLFIRSAVSSPSLREGGGHGSADHLSGTWGPSSPVTGIGSGNIRRSASLLNMTEYMNSINESNAEDDGAIFF